MPEYSSTTSILFIALGVLYGGGFLFAAWFFVRKISATKQRNSREEDRSNSLTEKDKGSRNHDT